MIGVGAMEPYIQPEDEKFMRMRDALRQCLTNEEWEEIGCIVCFSRTKPVPPYNDVDDLDASIAFSRLRDQSDLG
jgi:hypothetical protein